MIAGLIGAATITVPAATTAPKYLVIAAIALVGYITLQMLHAVHNTVKGLASKRYRSATPESVAPNGDDDNARYVVRQVNGMMNAIRQNDWITNQKINHMNLAHTALENTFWPAITLLLIALTLALLKIFQ